MAQHLARVADAIKIIEQYAKAERQVVERIIKKFDLNQDPNYQLVRRTWIDFSKWTPRQKRAIAAQARALRKLEVTNRNPELPDYLRIPAPDHSAERDADLKPFDIKHWLKAVEAVDLAMSPNSAEGPKGLYPEPARILVKKRSKVARDAVSAAGALLELHSIRPKSTNKGNLERLARFFLGKAHSSKTLHQYCLEYVSERCAGKG